MHKPDPEHLFLTRRELLSRVGMGFGALALGGLSETQAATQNPMAIKPPQSFGRAKRVVHFFMNGGPSHIDTFDPKPALEKWHGKALPTGSFLKTERTTGSVLKSPFKFQQHGESGIPISDIFPNVAKHADDLCVIRSMKADVPNHEPSLLLMNCGDARLPRPSVGSWVVYGLGTENENLPAYISLCPGGIPTSGAQNWQAGFLPGVFQGSHIDTKHREIEKLIANIRNPRWSHEQQSQQMDLLKKLNAAHLERREADRDLETRIQSFELAYRMQSEATDAFDIEKEDEATRAEYGDSDFGRQTLMARRLIERGVRYIQVWTGAGQPWDDHNNIDNHRKLAEKVDQPIAAFISDLKRRGLFDETLVIWGGEFGRTPVVELPMAGTNNGLQNGRDHNHHGFTTWMAGGGARPGHIHGKTDEFGFATVEDPVHVHDFHATILHLLGFDHEKFTYRYAGRDFRLTDVHGHVVKDLLA